MDPADVQFPGDIQIPVQGQRDIVAFADAQTPVGEFAQFVMGGVLLPEDDHLRMVLRGVRTDALTDGARRGADQRPCHLTAKKG